MMSPKILVVVVLVVVVVVGVVAVVVKNEGGPEKTQAPAQASAAPSQSKPGRMHFGQPRGELQNSPTKAF